MAVGTTAELDVMLKRGNPDRVWLPIEGSVRQVGLSLGLHADGWVGDELRFWIVASEPIHAMRIEGYTPFETDEPVALRVTLAGVCTTSGFDVGTFQCRIPCVVPIGTIVEVVIDVERTWRPSEISDSIDDRNLSFILSRIGFDRGADEASALPVRGRS
jgi:hypothetical protein